MEYAVGDDTVQSHDVLIVDGIGSKPQRNVAVEQSRYRHARSRYRLQKTVSKTNSVAVLCKSYAEVWSAVTRSRRIPE